MEAPVLFQEGTLIYVIAPVVGGLVFVALIVLIVLVMSAKKKRSLYGTYSPQKQEYNAPRMELAEMKMRIPPEERLI